MVNAQEPRAAHPAAQHQGQHGERAAARGGQARPRAGRRRDRQRPRSRKPGTALRIVARDVFVARHVHGARRQPAPLASPTCAARRWCSARRLPASRRSAAPCSRPSQVEVKADLPGESGGRPADADRWPRRRVVGRRRGLARLHRARQVRRAVHRSVREAEITDHPGEESRAAGRHAAGEELSRPGRAAALGRLVELCARSQACPDETAYLLARAIHRAEAPLAARLEQARETTMANTLAAAPRPELCIRACGATCARRSSTLAWRASRPGHSSYQDTAGAETERPGPTGRLPARRLRHQRACGSTRRRRLPRSGYRFVAYDRRADGSAGRRSRGAAAAPAPRALPSRRHRGRRHRGGRLRALLPQRLRSLVLANSIVGVQDEDYLALSRRLRPVAAVQRAAGRRARARPLLPRRQPGRRRSAGARSRTHRRRPQPARNRITFAALETITDADAADHRRRRPLHAAAGASPVREANQNSESVVLPECGHSAFWEQPKPSTAAVLEFIRQSTNSGSEPDFGQRQDRARSLGG